MAVSQTRPYRRILTSALHRRFVHASALSLLVCYIVAIAIGDKSSCECPGIGAGARAIAADVLFLSQSSGHGSPLGHAECALFCSSSHASPSSYCALDNYTLAREQHSRLSPRLDIFSLFISLRHSAGICSPHGGSLRFICGPPRQAHTWNW